jgi:regulator of sigma E protease
MFGTTLDFLLVLLGFGLIVFIHELGHFVAARWAGIRVMAFAVGFGPAILSFRKGLGVQAGSSEREYLRRQKERSASDLSPTEYRLNALPFGGYVKMLGQEDGNPYAVSEASDSFQSCKPWKRLVVISAGVVMNIITAAALFVCVFMVGMKVEPAKVGAVAPGSPAALATALNADSAGVTRAGLAPGDSIIAINGSKPNSFSDLMLATAMAERDSAIELLVARRGNATPLNFIIKPTVGAESGMLELGIEPARSASVLTARNEQEASEMVAAFESLGLKGLTPGMTIESINGRPVTDGSELFTALATSGGEAVTAVFKDGSQSVTHTFVPRPEMQLDYLQRATRAVVPIDHLLGLMPVMTVGQTTERSEAAGLRSGDIFARLGNAQFPSIAEGMAEIQARKGASIAVTVLRKDEAGAFKEIVLSDVSVNAKGQIGFGVGDTARDLALVSLPLPSLNHPGTQTRFAPAASGVFTIPGARIVSIDGRPVANFADIRHALREATSPRAGGTYAAGTKPTMVEVRFRRPVDGVLSEEAAIESLSWRLNEEDVRAINSLGWKSPISPGLFQTEEILLKATSPAEALGMGFAETKRVMLTTYMTFARLFQGTVKVEHLKGPVGIAHLGTLVAGRGFIWLLFFLALISVNLAVVNFLPLPIVDGGQFLFILWEQLRGKPVPLAFQSAATLAGLALIGCVFLIVTYNDIRNLLGF